MDINLEQNREQTKYSDVGIGIVIPIYQAKFIGDLIRKIMKLGAKRTFILCIVNDGIAELADYLNRYTWPDNVLILNLSVNKQFAGANNAGWSYLKDQFPSLKYIGTLNDDTIPRKGWLDALVDSLEKYPQTALAGPIMETSDGWLGSKKKYAVWKYSSRDTSVKCIKNNIRKDEFVPFAGGFCFLARRDALEEVGGFDERFKNSCEDADLCLKLLNKKWRIVIATRSRVFHLGGASRYMQGTKTDIEKSHLLLAEKWGRDLSKYNI